MKQSLKKPSAELMNCCKAYLAAVAYANAVRPQVETIQHRALAERVYTSVGDNQRITEHCNAWMMDPKEMEIYVARLGELYRKAGFKVSDDASPLYIAMQRVQQEEVKLIRQSKELHSLFDVEKILHHTEQRKAYLNIVLQHIAPFFTQS